MFEYDEVIKKLSKLDGMNHGKAKRFLSNLITSEDFLRWVYVPEEGQPVSARQFQEVQNLLLTSKALRSICDGIEDMDYRVDRAVSTFLNALTQIAVETYNEKDEALTKERRSGSISNKDSRILQEKLDTYRKDVMNLSQCAKRIVKREVKALSNNTNLSKDICRLGFWFVPGKKYLTRNRLAVFLKELLRAIYDNVSTEGFRSYGITPKWEVYFDKIFGRENVYSVATFILLEGVNVTDKYKGTAAMGAVRDCWDSLTDFALSVLNSAPDEMRNQMMELYLKRVDRMFRNHTWELRVDLRKLPETYSRLVKTVTKYADKLNTVLNRAKQGADTKVEEA